LAKSRRRSLLEHFGTIKDTGSPVKSCTRCPKCRLWSSATIASCDDYDEIVVWGEAHSGFLRRFLPYHWGIPCEDWLRVVMNRLDRDLFSACFTAWAAELRPEAIDLVAIKPAPAQAGGKTSRRSHDRAKARRPCIGSAPGRATSASCSANRRSRRSPTKSPHPGAARNSGDQRGAGHHRRHRRQPKDRPRPQ